MNQEEAFENQLNEDKARDLAQRAAAEKAERRKETAEGIKGTLLKLLKNPFLQWLVPILAEVLTGGLAPGWSAFVLWNYIVEKSEKKSPNLAAYLIIGIFAVIVDAFQIFFDLTGALLILSYAIIGPCLAILYIWKILKTGLKAPGPVKAKK